VETIAFLQSVYADLCCRYYCINVEYKIMSAASDVRQRRQKVVSSNLVSEANGADDRFRLGDADDNSKSSLAVSAAWESWFCCIRFCAVVVVVLVCGWAFASYVKQLHETHLWFSNIQVRCLDALNQVLISMYHKNHI